MKIVKVSYFKESKSGPGEYKDYEILVINQNDNYIEGISMGDLPLEDKEKLKELVKSTREILKPYVGTSYRKLLRNKIKKETV